MFSNDSNRSSYGKNPIGQSDLGTSRNLFIDLASAESKKKEEIPKFPVNKTTKYTNEMVLKSVKKREIDGAKEAIIRAITKPESFKISAEDIEICLTDLSYHKNDNDAQLIFYCYKIKFFMETANVYLADQFKAEAEVKFKENPKFLELINSVYKHSLTKRAQSLYEQALAFNSSLSAKNDDKTQEETKEALATLLAAILLQHSGAWTKFNDQLSLLNSDSESTKKRVLRLTAHLDDIDPRISLVATMYYILDKNSKISDYQKNDITKYLKRNNSGQMPKDSGSDYFITSDKIDPFIVLNFSKYCYSQGFITPQLYLEIMDKVSNARQEVIVDSLANKFFAEKIRVLVDLQDGKALVEAVDKGPGVDYFTEKLTNVEDWFAYVQHIKFYKFYAANKSENENLVTRWTSFLSESEILAKAFTAIASIMPEQTNENNNRSGFFAQNELNIIKSALDNLKDKEQAQTLTNIQKICQAWSDKNELKENILKIIQDVNDLLPKSVNPQPINSN